MIHVQKYCARRIKDGTEVRGYAAVGCESGAVWIMVPVKGTDDFSCVQVEPESLIPLC